MENADINGIFDPSGMMATLVGTPPNLSFVRIFVIFFPDAPEIAFSKWLIFALPVSLILYAMIWTLLYFSFRPKKGEWVTIAFMLPVATPPNAIIFGSGRITIATMARTGLVINLAGAVVITLMVYFWGSIVFGFDLHDLPSWIISK